MVELSIYVPILSLIVVAVNWFGCSDSTTTDEGESVRLKSGSRKWFPRY